MIFINSGVPNNAVSVTIQILPNNLSPMPFPMNHADLRFFDWFCQSIQAIQPLMIIHGYYDRKRQCVRFRLMVRLVISLKSSNNPAVPEIFASPWTPTAWINRSTMIYPAEVITTNDLGNYFQVLSNLNQSIGTSNPVNAANGAVVLPLRNRHEHVGGGRVGRAGVDAGLFHQPMAYAAQPGLAQGDAHQRRALRRGIL